MPHAYAPYETSPGLPDPELRADFYSGTVIKRFCAWLLDLIIVALITGVFVLFTIGIGLFFLPVIWLIADFCYRTITLTGRSATLGHRLFGIEFRDRYGKRFDLASAGLHTVGYLVSTSFLLPQVVSVVLMLTSARKQGLVDMIMGAALINRPSEPL